MAEPPTAAEFNELTEQAVRVPEIVARPAAPERLLKAGWPSIAVSIIVAGGGYSVVLSSVYVTIGFFVILSRLFFGNSNLVAVPFLVGSAFIGVVYAVLLGIVGMMWTSAVTAVALPILYAVAWSLQLRVNIVWLAAFSGGLIGFVAVLPMMLHIPEMIGANDRWMALITLVLGPGLSTVLGQIGGAWGGWRAARRAADKVEWHRALVAIGWRTDPPPAPENAQPPNDAAEPQFRFQIRHLLWLSVWLSLLLSVIRLSGVPFEFALPLLVGWGVYQSATLFVGAILMKRVARRWQTPDNRRST
jgi:hypothetical protein